MNDARNKATEKAREILAGFKAEGYDDKATAAALALGAAMITSADKSLRETGKRRLRELATKGKTGE